MPVAPQQCTIQSWCCWTKSNTHLFLSPLWVTLGLFGKRTKQGRQKWTLRATKQKWKHKYGHHLCHGLTGTHWCWFFPWRRSTQYRPTITSWAHVDTVPLSPCSIIMRSHTSSTWISQALLRLNAALLHINKSCVQLFMWPLRVTLRLFWMENEARRTKRSKMAPGKKHQ